MKREDQKFQGILTDREIGIIEDALLSFKNEPEDKEIDKLILKLYKFWEV